MTDWLIPRYLPRTGFAIAAGPDADLDQVIASIILGTPFKDQLPLHLGGVLWIAGVTGRAPRWHRRFAKAHPGGAMLFECRTGAIPALTDADAPDWLRQTIRATVDRMAANTAGAKLRIVAVETCHGAGTPAEWNSICTMLVSLAEDFDLLMLAIDETIIRDGASTMMVLRSSVDGDLDQA